MYAIRERVFQGNMQLKQEGLITLTWGNASAIDENRERLFIKPSGVPYDQLKPEHIVEVDIKTGETINSALKPSSDLKTHLELYRHFDSIGGVVHTHSTHATAWAQANREIPCFGTTHADYFYGSIPVSRPLSEQEINEDYETHSGKVIIETLTQLNRNPQSTPGILLGSHAPFTWGSDIEESVYNAIVLEEVAKMAWLTLQINPQAKPAASYLMDKHYQRKHGPNAYYGQN